MSSAGTADDTAPEGIRLSVMGSFDLRRTDGEALLPALTGEAQRLLAFLAIRGRLVSRSAVAGTLWPEAAETRAYASLRSALSRLSELAQDAVAITDTDLELSTAVSVDLHDARQLARRLLEQPPGGLERSDLGLDAIEMLSLDCLPDWYDDWVLIEAEEWRQLRLHALDALAISLVGEDRFGAAIAAALAAVRTDPMRESAWATLMRVHLAEGNQSEALRTFRQYRDLVSRELHIEPTERLRGLLPRTYDDGQGS